MAQPTLESPTPEHPTASPVPQQPSAFNVNKALFTANIELKSFQPAPYPAQKDALPINLAQINNPAVLNGLSAQQKDFLSQNGFVVMNAGDTQFKDLRRSVSDHFGQPYYLTTDAAYHALHKTFDEMLAALESEYLRPVLGRLLQAEYAKTGEYKAAVAGQTLEKDVDLSQKYAAVAIKLLYPDQTFDLQIETAIAPQIAQIMAYGGKADSVLISGFTDDYGAYRPVGHYAGKPALESYFRSMTWLGRVAFQLKAPNDPTLVPSRAPLILTLALREAKVEELPAYQVWVNLYEIIDFLVGPSDDPGPLELNQLMEQVYGKSLSLSDLADQAKWQTFLAKTDQLPAPQINSTFVSFSVVQAASRDWRFMGQRFTLDSFIFQSLIFDKIGTQEKPRKLPSGLDVAAAFGSQSAYQTLKASGASDYLHYDDQMAAVQKIVNTQPENQWLNRFYSAWLYAFSPQVATKDANFPPYMRTAAWSYKDINSTLGSWAEFKHDTVLYFKMPEGIGGGGPPMSGPTPAYVEPNPNVFYRLSYAAKAALAGLNPLITDWSNRGWREDSNPEDPNPITFNEYQKHMDDIATQFEQFGDIAARELRSDALTTDDFNIIQTCLEMKECMYNTIYSRNPPEPDPIPVVAAVSGSDNDVLEAGVGNLDRIFVAVPLEGKLEIAQGGVFSYYEFTQPRSDRLTDEAWREKLKNNPPTAPAWVSQFNLPGGKPTNALAFRVGDVYILTEKGFTPLLNLRAGASATANVLCKLDQAVYITIKDGPVKNGKDTWWNVEMDFPPPGCASTQGWILENQDWYVRSAID